MDFRLVQKLREADVFQPATVEDVKSRDADPRRIKAAALDMVVLKDLAETNLAKNFKLTDEQWGNTVLNMVEAYPEVGLEGLQKLENELMNFLMAADELTDRSGLK
jgi:hypothetical protein